jgi:hypothetical protein
LYETDVQNNEVQQLKIQLEEQTRKLKAKELLLYDDIEADDYHKSRK